MKKTLLIFLMIMNVAFCSDKALQLMENMLHSLDHIKTWQSDVYMHKQDRGEITSMNYVIKSDDENAVALVEVETAYKKRKRKQKVAYVKNSKGFYITSRHDAKKQPEWSKFPFEVPNAFLKELNLDEVKDSAKFMLAGETTANYKVRMIPLGIGDRIDEMDDQDNIVTMIEFLIDKNTSFLNMVEIYYNHKISTEDYVKYSYGFVDNKVLLKKGVFRNKYSKTRELAPVKSESVSYLGKSEQGYKEYQIKTAEYSNIVINEELDKDIFDEEEY